MSSTARRGGLGRDVRPWDQPGRSVPVQCVVIVLTALFVALSAVAFSTAALAILIRVTVGPTAIAHGYDSAVLSDGRSVAKPNVAPGFVAVPRQMYEDASNLARTSARQGVGLLAPNTADDFVNLASPSRTRHILDGEVRPNGTFGGGHRPGTGFPNKSEFPAGWSDGRIMHEISDVATDPRIPWRAGDGPTDFWANGTRRGVDIEVLIRNGEIWTGYPTNLPRNPL